MYLLNREIQEKYETLRDSFFQDNEGTHEISDYAMQGKFCRSGILID
jgi:hypothetical protein